MNTELANQKFLCFLLLCRRACFALTLARTLEHGLLPRTPKAMPEAPSQPSDAEDNTAASSVPTAPAPASAFGMRSSLFSLSQRVPDGSGLATSAFSLQSSTSSFIGARSTNVLAPAPASAMSATAVAGAPATEPMVDLEVCTMLNPKNGTKLRVPANATIAEVKAQLRPSGEMVTLLWAGQMLTCPSETLCELGISGSQRLSMVDRMTPDTGPLGMIQLSDAAKAAAARAAAATAAGFSPVGPAASPGSASEPLAAGSAAAGASSANAAAPVQVTKVNGQKMQVPYDAAMTGIGLKRQLQLRGEGDVRAIRLICLGKELVDDLPLSAQRVQPGAIVYFMLREVPPSAAGGASGLGSRLGAGAAGSWGPVSHGSGNGAAGERREGQWVGLRNQGATCYLNSLVQALFMTPSFRASYAVSTEGLTSALKWGPVSRQQDVHEFWTMLCERIEADLKGTAHGTLVEDLFQGEQRDYVRCHTSAGVRLLATLDTHDAAHDDDTSAAPSNASLWETSNASSALSGGSPTMTPSGGSPTMTPSGGSPTMTPSGGSPTMTPSGGSPLSAAAVKVAGDASTMDVDTPTVVEGEAAMGTPSAAVYELYAVLVHKGSASFGHYYALLQDVERGEWYEFNDATVKPIKPSELRRAVGGAESAASGSYSWSGSTCAYMLLYRQVTDPKRIQQALAAAAAAPGVMATPQDRFPSTGGHTLGGAPGGAGVGSGGAASGGTPVGGGGVRMSRLLSAATSSTASAGETRSPLAPASENAKRLREASEQTDEPAGTTHAAPICFTHEPVEEDNPYARMGF
eukprot:jgi/Chrpa1/1834/Chrysochromulina_OHIO_Genome00015925-RA